MFDIGWTEMLVVAVVAIIVVGPKDLPGMLRTVGKTVKKLRGMAGDFQRQFDDALKEAELDEVKNSIDNVRSMNPLNDIKDSLNPLKDSIKDIEAGFNDDDGPVDPGQEDEGDYPFDAGDLFDETKQVKVAKPVKVDVEAALAREKAKTAKAAKRASTKLAGGAAKKKPAKKSTTAKKPATKKPVAKKAAAKKSAARPVKKSTAKPAAKAKTGKTAKAQSA